MFHGGSSSKEEPHLTNCYSPFSPENSNQNLAYQFSNTTNNTSSSSSPVRPRPAPNFSEAINNTIIVNIQQKYGGNKRQLQSLKRMCITLNSASKSLDYLIGTLNLFSACEETRKLWAVGIVLGPLSTKESHDLFCNHLRRYNQTLGASPATIFCLVRLSSQPGVLTVTTTFQTAAKVSCPECNRSDCNVRHVRVNKLSDFQKLFEVTHPLFFLRTGDYNRQPKYVEREAMIQATLLPISCSGPIKAFGFTTSSPFIDPLSINNLLPSNTSTTTVENYVAYIDNKIPHPGFQPAKEIEMQYLLERAAQFNPCEIEEWDVP